MMLRAINRVEINVNIGSGKGRDHQATLKHDE
jgi:hypothetical protein